MDAGAFGCLGVGVPFAIAAALAMPDRQVISVNGDGAFGINAMEIDTAVRHGAKCVFIVSNNAAWNIERIDQEHELRRPRRRHDAAPFRLCRRWRGRSACTANASRTPDGLRRRLAEGACATRRRWSML